MWKMTEHLRAAGLLGLGDKGYVGLDEVVLVRFKGCGEPQWKKEVNSDHAKLRSPGERAIAQLKNWRILCKLRCCSQRAGEIRPWSSVRKGAISFPQVPCFLHTRRAPANNPGGGPTYVCYRVETTTPRSADHSSAPKDRWPASRF